MFRRVAVHTAGAVTEPAATLVSSGDVPVLPEPCHSSVLYEAIDTLARWACRPRSIVEHVLDGAREERA